jgi:signal transduction histidine kinase
MIEQIASASTTKFSTELDDIDGLLAPDMEISVYRIVQEGLNNVMKHAQATQVIVEIKRDSQAISVSIFDDGCGFDTSGPQTEKFIPAGFGLTGMSERAKAIGGWLELRSARGTGTRITLSVPLSKPSTLSA